MPHREVQTPTTDFRGLFRAEQLFILEALEAEEREAVKAASTFPQPRGPADQSGEEHTDGEVVLHGSKEHSEEKLLSTQDAYRKRILKQQAICDTLQSHQPSERKLYGAPALKGDDWSDSDAAPAIRSASISDARTDDGGAAEDDDGASQMRISTARYPGEEPFVSFMSGDQAGLALSGGGIRSATFNLGLLQGLADLGLLRHFDYLSTVSGGGYIGGWWSAWRSRGGSSATDFFPTGDQSLNTDADSHVLKDREPEEVKHLRGFSNFLAPRVGLFSPDMWNGVVAIISGLLPSFLMAASLLTLVLAVFVLAAVVFAGWPIIFARHVVWFPISFAFGLLTFVILESLERRYRNFYRRITAPRDLAEGFYSRHAFLTFVLAGGLCLWGFYLSAPATSAAPGQGSRASAHSLSNDAQFLLPGLQQTLEASESQQLPETAPEPPPRVVKLGDGVDLHVEEPQEPTDSFEFNTRLLFPAAIWTATGLVLLTFRYRASWLSDVEDSRRRIAASGRILGRLGKAALIWTVFVLLWEFSRYLLPITVVDQTGTVSGLAAALAVGAELFRRSSLILSRESSSADNPTILSRLKGLLPQLLAYGVIAIGVVLICFLMRWLLSEAGNFSGAMVMLALMAGCGIVLLALCWWLNPEALGLHAFYRDRLARAYLGASNGPAETQFFAWQNLQTIQRNGDDLNLRSLRYGNSEAESQPECRRPYHLICCAANDLSADAVATLGRGARSAVLSCDGLAIGNDAAVQPDLTMASAQTASAAAFNSLMGSKSMTFGPGVSFLMTALNLRLGLWCFHPATGRSGRPPWAGFRVLKEMVSSASAGFLPSRGTVGDAKDLLQQDDVHLSDGAHFENLGLYELIRRHCRYIVVSDCGADPEIAFDDFGNALRRIREDFSVEIEIDLSPLKPDADGLATQHMAVGTIHYDRKNDKGILLYFKPSLTGDEPDDVTQYRTRNQQFPNETTADQFYDEAQWESYRRLGEHASRSALRFCEHLDSDEHGGTSAITAQAMFTEAFWRWYPVPADVRENILLMTDRFTSLQEKLRISKQTRLFEEICPEATAFSRKHEDRQPPPIPPREELQELLPLLLQIMQLMEDAFIGCRLETYSAHPMNLGWVNLIHRWANAATFRNWWPILQPLFSREFRHFMNHHVGLHKHSPIERPVTQLLSEKWIREIQRSNDEDEDSNSSVKGYAAELWQDETNATLGKNDRLFEFCIPLGDEGLRSAQNPDVPRVQIAFCRLTADTAKRPKEKRGIASLTTSDLYVPAGLWGTGIGSRFLSGVLRLLTPEEEDAILEVRVVFRKPKTREQERKKDEFEHRGAQALLETDEASRSAHADQIRFYKAAGFELRLDGSSVPNSTEGTGVLPPEQILVLELSGPSSKA